MAYTVYDSTIVVSQGILNTLSHILHEAEKRPNANTLLEARLHEDMYQLPHQIRLVTQFSENLVARLTGRDPVKYEGDLASFVDLHERIETVLKRLKEADKKIVNENGDIVAPTVLGPGITVEMSGATYTHLVALPNMYFHVSTAYGILRKEGVPLGKMDFWSGFAPLAMPASQ